MHLNPSLYDVIIVGGGIAGLTAGIYCGRAGLNVMILEKDAPGGKIINAELVEDFPGFPDGISGADLGANMMMQAMKWGAKLEYAELTGIETKSNPKVLHTNQGNLSTKTVVIASGCGYRKLNIPGEEEFLGKKIFHCALCDGNRFRDQEVAVIGGGEGGMSEALYLDRIASKITIIEITPQVNASEVLVKRAKESHKIIIQCSTAVERMSGGGDTINLHLKNIITNDTSNLIVGGIFILVGLEPETGYLDGKMELDGDGFIKVSRDMETNVPGVFAAGDIRGGSGWHAITAAGDGSIAALKAKKFINEKY